MELRWHAAQMVEVDTTVYHMNPTVEERTLEDAAASSREEPAV